MTHLHEPTQETNNARPQRVGLYGGSFDPPHMAHVLVAAWALSSGQIDQLWVIPNGGHPFGKQLTPFEDRMEMCRRAFECFGPRLQIIDVEREQRVHYTIDTVHALAGRFPGHTWRWVMGSDTLKDASKWRAYNELMELAPALVVARQGYDLQSGDQDAPAQPAAGLPLPNISSTLIRDLVRRGQTSTLEGLVPRAVADWIVQRGLYLGRDD